MQVDTAQPETQGNEAPQARGPWSAPVLTVRSVAEVTRVVANTYPSDGTNISS